MTTGGNDIENLLRLAKEAEIFAFKCNDTSTRDAFFRIAASYRQMAQHRLDRMGSVATSEQPSPIPAASAKRE